MFKFRPKHWLFLLVFAIAASFAQAQPAFTCPQFQHYNNAGACEFNSFQDTPAFLAQQNRMVAESLNANPTAPGAAFARAYGSLPQSVQNAVLDCEVAIYRASYFAGFTVPDQCGTNGVLDVAKIVSATPAPKNPGNAPSTTWDGKQFIPVVPPQPGKPTAVPQPPPPVNTATGRLVGFCYSDSQCQIAFGVDIRSLKNGQTTVQDGRAYVARIQMGMMGLGGYWEAQQ